jgi:hypothetical protein
MVPLSTLNNKKNIKVKATVINPNTGRPPPNKSFNDLFKDLGTINSDGTITINLKSVIDKKIELEYIKK